VVCRFETQVPVGNGHKKKIHQDIRSLVLSECQYQFGLGRSAKNAEVNPEDESGSFHGLFCSASCVTMFERFLIPCGTVSISFRVQPLTSP
jgi:hypothetical protein